MVPMLICAAAVTMVVTFAAARFWAWDVVFDTTPANGSFLGGGISCSVWSRSWRGN